MVLLIHPYIWSHQHFNCCALEVDKWRLKQYRELRLQISM